MWLLEPTARRVIEQAEKSGWMPTAEQQLEFEARGRGLPLAIGGGKAQISIDGVLTNRPSYMASFFGGGNTTYPDIRAAHAEAEADKSVKEVVVVVGSSPGGHIDGLFETIAALQAGKKPIRAVVSDQAASATYALVSQAGTVEAKNKGTRFGSIGIAVDVYASPNEISIASTAAPKKRPDVKTEEGQAIVREELDAIHKLFADSIATGRGTTIKNVNAEFGQGAMVLAEEAIKRGMIDGVQEAPVSKARTTTANLGGTQLEASNMDAVEFQATHPGTFKAVSEGGEVIGAANERDRVVAHLTFGEQSGDMKTALEAVKNGDEMTATIQAQYMTFGMNAANVKARGADEDDAGGGDDADGDDSNQADTVISAIEKKCGINGEV